MWHWTTTNHYDTIAHKMAEKANAKQKSAQHTCSGPDSELHTSARYKDNQEEDKPEMQAENQRSPIQ
jgi:hypothetical protein